MKQIKKFINIRLDSAVKPRNDVCKWIFFIISTFFFLSMAQAKAINIVVTVPYLKDLVQNVTCFSPDYKTNSFISAGVDPHTFVLAPNDRIRLTQADLVIQIGAGLEPWLDKIKDNKQSHVILSEHLKFKRMDPAASPVGSPRDDKHESRDDNSLDPHIWHSPKLTEDAVILLAKTFEKINPQDKNRIEKCTKNYIDNIHSTVEKLKKQLTVIPQKNRILATNHDSLGYFAQTFDFKIYSILGLSDEEEPSLAQLKNLITTLEKQKIKAVFLETTGNSKNMQTVADNAHVKIGGKLYGDSFGEIGSHADTTLGVWQSNVNTIIQGLSEKSVTLYSAQGRDK
jgi:ABC-type Zn uptake system ZnuABC Zn-binding protein ZnuA